MSGTARTHSYATATAYSAPTSSTAAVTSRWGTLGTTSTSLPSGVRRSGRTRRRATVRRRRTSGGTGTTNTATTKLPPRSSNRSAGAAQPGRPATSRDALDLEDQKRRIYAPRCSDLFIHTGKGCRVGARILRREVGL